MIFYLTSAECAYNYTLRGKAVHGTFRCAHVNSRHVSAAYSRPLLIVSLVLHTRDSHILTWQCQYITFLKCCHNVLHKCLKCLKTSRKVFNIFQKVYTKYFVKDIWKVSWKVIWNLFEMLSQCFTQVSKRSQNQHIRFLKYFKKISKNIFQKIFELEISILNLLYSYFLNIQLLYIRINLY